MVVGDRRGVGCAASAAASKTEGADLLLEGSSGVAAADPSMESGQSGAHAAGRRLIDEGGGERRQLEGIPPHCAHRLLQILYVVCTFFHCKMLC